MGGDLQALFQSLTTQLDETARHFPAAIAEVRGQDADSATMLETVFADINTHLASLRNQFAEFAADFDKQLEEAGRMAQDAKSAFENASEPPPVPAPPAPARPPLDLAPRLGAELLDRYAPTGPAAKEHSTSGSSVWFDFSSHSSDAGPASNELDETLAILAGMTRRCVVWWTCVAISEAISNVWHALTANDRGAVESAVAWVLSPDEARRQSSMRFSAQERPGSLAHGFGELFRMMGSTDPQSLAERAMAEAALSVLRLSCDRLDAATSANVIRHSREIAVDMKAGRRLWQGHSAATNANVVDSLASLSRWIAKE